MSYDPQTIIEIVSDGGTVTLTRQIDVVVTGSASQTLTLPPAAAGPGMTIKNLSSGSITVNRAGSDTIDGGTSKLLLPYAAASFKASGTAWTVR